ncbi:CD209 antigen-like protein E [Biomphalaria pfeifferi]|uniref:CD209 antigen-like protein E n=1 Tax=Biomphalaria pfeifferi TaxID=112525 RepID=A0AAD8BX67_BIOPF|nr:CD209 antigen-like protein E [Biomphalaria pfeifferi]
MFLAFKVILEFLIRQCNDLGSAGIKPSSRDRLYSQSTQYCDVSLGYNSTITRTQGLCLSQHPQKPFLQLTALVLACKANW